MKTASRILILGAALAGAVATGVHAQPARRANMTCSEFLALDDQTRPKVVFWAEGVSKSGRPEDAVVDVESVNRIVPMVVDVCRRNPQGSFLNSLRTSEGRAQ